MLVLATAGWGLSFPLMKGLVLEHQRTLPGANEWFVTAQSLTIRFTLAALVMGLVFWKRMRKLNRAEIKLGVGLGLFAGVGSLLQMVGVGHTLASTSAFLTQTYVLILPVAGAVVRRKFPSWMLCVSCCLVVIGMGVLCRVNWRDLQLGRGEILTLFGAVAFACDILWLDRAEFAAADKLTGSAIMFATIGLMFAPVAIWFWPVAGSVGTVYQSPAVLTMMVLLILVSTVFAFSMVNYWQTYISPSRAGLVYCAEPMFASVYALFIPALIANWGGYEYANESLTGSLWLGGGLITLANVIGQGRSGDAG